MDFIADNHLLPVIIISIISFSISFLLIVLDAMKRKKQYNEYIRSVAEVEGEMMPEVEEETQPAGAYGDSYVDPYGATNQGYNPYDTPAQSNYGYSDPYQQTATTGPTGQYPTHAATGYQDPYQQPQLQSSFQPVEPQSVAPVTTIPDMPTSIFSPSPTPQEQIKETAPDPTTQFPDPFAGQKQTEPSQIPDFPDPTQSSSASANQFPDPFGGTQTPSEVNSQVPDFPSPVDAGQSQQFPNPAQASNTSANQFPDPFASQESPSQTPQFPDPFAGQEQPTYQPTTQEQAYQPAIQQQSFEPPQQQIPNQGYGNMLSNDSGGEANSFQGYASDGGSGEGSGQGSYGGGYGGSGGGGGSIMGNPLLSEEDVGEMECPGCKAKIPGNSTTCPFCNLVV